MGKTYRDGIHGGNHTRGPKHNKKFHDNHTYCDLHGTDACIDCENFRSCHLTRSDSAKRANTKLKHKLDKRKEPLYTDES